MILLFLALAIVVPLFFGLLKSVSASKKFTDILAVIYIVMAALLSYMIFSIKWQVHLPVTIAAADWVKFLPVPLLIILLFFLLFKGWKNRQISLMILSVCQILVLLYFVVSNEAEVYADSFPAMRPAFPVIRIDTFTLASLSTVLLISAVIALYFSCVEKPATGSVNRSGEKSLFGRLKRAAQKSETNLPGERITRTADEAIARLRKAITMDNGEKAGKRSVHKSYAPKIEVADATPDELASTWLLSEEKNSGAKAAPAKEQSRKNSSVVENKTTQNKGNRKDMREIIGRLGIVFARPRFDASVRYYLATAFACGVLLSNHALWTYAFLQLVLISVMPPSAYSEDGTPKKVSVLPQVGMLLFLVSAVIFNTVDDTLNFDGILSASVLGKEAILSGGTLLFVALMILAAQFPFSGWIHDRTLNNPYDNLMLLQVPLQLSLFLLLRLSSVYWQGFPELLLVYAGGISFAAGAVLALKQKDMARAFAFIQSSYGGLLIACVAIGSQTSLNTAALLFLLWPISTVLLYGSLGRYPESSISTFSIILAVISFFLPAFGPGASGLLLLEDLTAKPWLLLVMAGGTVFFIAFWLKTLALAIFKPEWSINFVSGKNADIPKTQKSVALSGVKYFRAGKLATGILLVMLLLSAFILPDIVRYCTSDFTGKTISNPVVIEGIGNGLWVFRGEKRVGGMEGKALLLMVTAVMLLAYSGEWTIALKRLSQAFARFVAGALKTLLKKAEEMHAKVSGRSLNSETDAQPADEAVHVQALKTLKEVAAATDERANDNGRQSTPMVKPVEGATSTIMADGSPLIENPAEIKAGEVTAEAAYVKASTIKNEAGESKAGKENKEHSTDGSVSVFDPEAWMPEFFSRWKEEEILGTVNFISAICILILLGAMLG